MTEEDDWAPLPADQLLAHPGEFAAPAAAEPTRASSPPSPPPAEPSFAPAVEAHAEQALLQLKQRLAQAPSADSFVAALHHREQKAARKRRAAQLALAEVPAAALAAPPLSPTSPSQAPAEPPTSSPDHDPREREPWFVGLPEQEQQRLRQHWWTERHRHDDERVLRQRRLRRAIVYGMGLFCVLGAVHAVIAGSWLVWIEMIVGGGIAAAAADLCGGGRFAYAGFGAMVCLIVMGPAVIMDFTGTALVSLACYSMALIGMDGEMRQRGGFRED